MAPDGTTKAHGLADIPERDMSIEPHIDRAADDRDSLYVQEECYRYYVGVRRDHCTFMQLLDLTLQAPYCESCAWWGGSPDITSDSWQSDLIWAVGAACSAARSPR